MSFLLLGCITLLCPTKSTARDLILNKTQSAYFLLILLTNTISICVDWETENWEWSKIKLFIFCQLTMSFDFSLFKLYKSFQSFAIQDWFLETVSSSASTLRRSCFVLCLICFRTYQNAACEIADSAPHEFPWLWLGWLGFQQGSLFLVGGDILLMFSPSNSGCCWSGERVSRWWPLPLSFLFQLQRSVQERVAPCLPSTTPPCFSCVSWLRGREWCKFFCISASNPMCSIRNTWEILWKKIMF